MTMASFARSFCTLLVISHVASSLAPKPKVLIHRAHKTPNLKLTPGSNNVIGHEPIKNAPEHLASSAAIEYQKQFHILTKYAMYWENLLLEEYRENVEELKHRRRTWTRSRLESSGMSIFSAAAEPDSELYGEKIVRVNKFDDNCNFSDKFSKGEVLQITPEASFRGKDPIPKEGIVTDVGKHWMTLGVGSSWPLGLFEMRKHAGKYLVRIDRSAPVSPLRAQQSALEKLRKGAAGDAATLLARMFYLDDDELMEGAKDSSASSESAPEHFADDDLEGQIINALESAISSTSLEPNLSQKEAVIYALSRKIGLIRGPPGTGKTRVAALLISTALKMNLKQPSIEGESQHPRILAVTHSNNAADVLVEALLQLNVPAVRSGRPASVSPSVQHRTILAIAENDKEVIRLRQKASDASLDRHTRQAAAFDAKGYTNDLQNIIARTAPVVVTSCIGAQQLTSSIAMDDQKKESIFPIVVLDEAAQTTEPALICALAAAKASQLICVGDTQQLPPTVGTENAELRNTLGVSPMERLLKNGVTEFTLKEQYRMPAALLLHPNQYFYNGLVQCAIKGGTASRTPPKGFPWPSPSEPLAFLSVGNDSELSHNFGSKSNPMEVEVIIDIIRDIVAAGEVQANKIAVITPYSKQVQLLQTELNSVGYMYASKTSEVKVGTVDSFQGQETDLVIFSAVRSNVLKELGFLRDKRRLNVAITRAKRGLIIVGDPTVLKTCRHWSALLDSCTSRNCVISRQDYHNHNAVKAVHKKRNTTNLELDLDDEFFGLF
mmetsp:Transcript_22929/g.46357  ORF Transcript_22929/g.46357 Transcript_22929/m.46357 type:complete len:779 (-) Transcript_22929:109-2445(-)